MYKSMISTRFFRFAVTTLSCVLALQTAPAVAATISGETVKWHPITLDFDGPRASETDQNPNPFLDYRLNVTLTAPSGASTEVPGFFAGNGDGGGTGNVWRIRFSPNEAGQWSYQASFRQGANVAVSLDDNAGNAANLNGSSGSFSVSGRRVNAPGFLSQGRLNYVGEHYLKFDDGGYWLKGGTDSPENLLGFRGIDNTVSQGGIEPNFLHDFQNHERDWNPGDPLFQSATSGHDSRGLIGALNYLNSVGVNSVYFLPMNLGGDGQDTYPFVGAANTAFNKTHYDISKLHQWNQVLDHAQRKSIFLHIVLSETERANERWLDNGNLGVERRLFFRELTARFGYILAAKWNLGEENDFPVAALREQARYLSAVDWSNKPIAVHTQIDNFRDYEVIVGDPLFSATSIQYTPNSASDFVERWREESAERGHPWVLDMDENTGGVAPGNVENRRKQFLYDIYFSGGQIEWYFGLHSLPLGGDINAGDFRQRERVWEVTRYAREFVEDELPFWEMEPADNLVTGEASAFGGAEVFAKRGDIYAIYLPQANLSPTLNLTGANGSFTLRWFNPRTGVFQGAQRSLNGGGNRALGNPPNSNTDDWVALVKRDGFNVSMLGPANDPVVAAPVVPEPEPVVQPVAQPAQPTEEQSSPAEPQVAAPTEEVEVVEEVVEETQPQIVAVSDSASNDPEFIPLESPIAVPGETLSFSVVAFDDDGIAPSVTVDEDLPGGMLMTGFGGGVLDFTWPVPADQANPVTITVVAIDVDRPSTRVTMDVVINVETGGSNAITENDNDNIESTPPAAAINDEPADTADTADADNQPEFILSDAAITDTEGNQPPVIVSLINQTVMVGERVQIPVVAIDPEGFVPALWSNNLPNGAALEDAGDGTRNLVWVPEPSQRGFHIIQVNAQDAVDPSIQITQPWTLEVIDQTFDTAPLFEDPVNTQQTAVELNPDETPSSNQAPFFPAIDPQQATVGEEFILSVVPVDPEGIAPHLQLDTRLNTAEFADDGNGGRILRWTPTADEVSITSLRFVTTDDDDESLSSMVDVPITVFEQ